MNVVLRVKTQIQIRTRKQYQKFGWQDQPKQEEEERYNDHEKMKSLYTEH